MHFEIDLQTYQRTMLQKNNTLAIDDVATAMLYENAAIDNSHAEEHCSNRTTQQTCSRSILQ